MRPADPPPQANDVGFGLPIPTAVRLPTQLDASPIGNVLARPHWRDCWLRVRWSHVTTRDYAEWKRSTNEDHIP